MEFTPVIGVGAADLQQVARIEVGRILKSAGHDDARQFELLLEMLVERGHVTVEEAAALRRLGEGARGRRTEGPDHDAFFAAREVQNDLLGGADTSPVALVIAAAGVGSWTPTANPDGSGTVVMAKSTSSFGPKWAAAGAIIGGALGGGVGGALGGAIGGVIGGIVDECRKD